MATKREQVIRLCHYCGERARTRDHVVPRSRLERGSLMLGQIIGNTVPACHSCNQRKGTLRVADCCSRCETLWVQYGPRGWATKVPTITLAELTSEALAAN